MKHSVCNVFNFSFFEKLLRGSSVTGLTQDSLIVLLSELNLYTKKNILVSLENTDIAFDFYNKGYEYKNSVFTYFPETKNKDNVPGFENENSRYQKESLLKTSSVSGVVCFGTLVSFNEVVVPKKYNEKIKSLCFFVGEKLKREDLVGFLDGLGYKKTNMVEGVSEYAFRGDVFDFFPPHLKNPIRISFSYEKIEDICVFDPVTSTQ